MRSAILCLLYEERSVDAQPIDTAPRDETFVLLYFPDAESGWKVGFWSEKYQNWYESECSSHALTDWDDRPTHWAPLPKTPTR